MADGGRHDDPVLARGLARPRRRDVLGLGGRAAAGLVLAACSGGGGSRPAHAAHTQDAAGQFWAARKRHGQVNFLHRRADPREHLDLHGLVRGHLPAEPELGTDLRFIITDEGGTPWTDNMMIPGYAQNPVDAMMLMDWYYRPETAAQLTESINYVSAAPAAQPIIARDARKAGGSSRQLPHEAATSELVWPASAGYQRLYSHADVSGTLQSQYEAAFSPVIRA